jgi:hypothetical protein
VVSSVERFFDFAITSKQFQAVENLENTEPPLRLQIQKKIIASSLLKP